ncbi:MAG: hypothetical protein M0Z61_10840 [Nitrospiraceae bacterium]|nr:hypothetical protein [Nitrospiraceae bacterium]
MQIFGIGGFLTMEGEKSKLISRFFLTGFSLICVLFLLQACGSGGGGSDTSSNTNGNNSTSSSQTPKNYTPVTLYSFTGGTDGGSPSGSMVVDSNGNLYGTTTTGGANGGGTAYKIDTTGKET